LPTGWWRERFAKLFREGEGPKENGFVYPAGRRDEALINLPETLFAPAQMR
jgi:hypothetical protein